MAGVRPQAGTTARRNGRGSSLVAVLGIPEVGVMVPLVLAWVGFGLANPMLYTPQVIGNVLRQASYVGVISVAMTFVFIAGGVDLSVGSVAAFIGAVSGSLMQRHVPEVLAVLAGLALAALVGLVNGAMVVRLRIPPFIATLGTMFAARGGTYIVCKGGYLSPLSEAFSNLGSLHVGAIPCSAFVFLALTVAGDYALRNTVFGRNMYAVGGNEEVARQAGIEVGKVKVYTYVLTALGSAVGGLLLTSATNAAVPAAGIGWEFQAITATIIGGASMFGGAGTALGAFLGTLLTSTIMIGMILSGISIYWQNIVLGAMVVGAVGLDTYRRRRIAAS